MGRISPHHLDRRIAALTALTLLLLAAACSSGVGTASDEGTQSIQNGDSEFLDPEGIQAEYQQAASELELPPGFAFPGDMGWDENGSYEQGCGVSAAQNYWKWAWITEWLEQRGVNSEREAKALDVLMNEVPESWLMTEGNDGSARQYYNMCLEKAELGDPSGFQQYLDANSPDLIRTGE